MLILIALCLIPIALCLFWYVIYLKNQRHLSAYHGPTPLPVVGNLFSVKSGKNLIPTFMNLQNKYGEIVNLTFGFSPRLLLTGFKPIEFLLSSNILINKSYDYEFYRRWLGNSLLISAGHKWRRQRKLLTPAFHFNVLEHFMEVFDKQSDVLLKKLEESNGSFDIFPYMKLYTLDVICEAVMNTTVNAQINSNSEFVENIEDMCGIITKRMTSPTKLWDFSYQFTDTYKAELKCIKSLHGLSNFMIEKRIQEINQEGEEDYDSKKKKFSFLDILLSSQIDGKPLSQEAIREEVDTFMFAGHDTTASGISFLLYCLSKHLDIQDKCFQEINDIVSDNLKKKFTCNDLRELKYLDQVIKETFRMYPPVVFISRAIKEDTCYEGHVWPKNLQLTLFIYGLHHQPSLYPNPEVFDPDRFSSENSRNRSLYSYIPFSAGSRNCIGQRFAMLEVKSTVVHVLRKFKILPVKDHQPVLVGDSILTSDNGLLIRLQKRY